MGRWQLDIRRTRFKPPKPPFHIPAYFCSWSFQSIICLLQSLCLLVITSIIRSVIDYVVLRCCAIFCYHLLQLSTYPVSWKCSLTFLNTSLFIISETSMIVIRATSLVMELAMYNRQRYSGGLYISGYISVKLFQKPFIHLTVRSS